MRDLWSKISPVWILRFGLGLTFLYSGQDLVRNPSAWQWALPFWLKEIIESLGSLNSYLRFQGMIELIFAGVFLSWFIKQQWLLKLVAFLATIEFAIIILLALIPFNEANFLITFRDIGLLGSALTLLVILERHPRF